MDADTWLSPEYAGTSRNTLISLIRGPAPTPTPIPNPTTAAIATSAAKAMTAAIDWRTAIMRVILSSPRRRLPDRRATLNPKTPPPPPEGPTAGRTSTQGGPRGESGAPTAQKEPPPGGRARQNAHN